MVQNKRHKPQGGRRRTTKKKKGDWLFVKLLGTVVIIFAVAFGIFRTLGAWNTKDISMPELFTTQEEQTLPADFDGNGLLDVKAPESMDEQFVIYKGFNVSFNTKHRIPNYVVYELTNTEVEGEEARAKSFRRDENVDNCPEPYDYTRSGYDRGHMAPAADMKWDNEAMRESFYMTNICPQKHALNGGGWKRLEEKLRDWAMRDGALVIVTGPVMGDSMPTIGEGVTVPPGFFKVVLAPNAKPMRAIGFLYKNEGGQKVVERQAVSVDSVETVTGFDFIYNLPDDVENEIEKSSNYQLWNN